jgi:hypothetical protein
VPSFKLVTHCLAFVEPHAGVLGGMLECLPGLRRRDNLDAMNRFEMCKKSTLVCVSLLVSALFVFGQQARSETQEAVVAPDQIARWVVNLDSDRYIERRQATEKLIAAGAASIQPILQAVQEGSLETVARGLHVLSELASSGDYTTECSAYEALELLVAKKGTVIARRASSILADMGPIRYERAKKYLTDKGAVISATSVFTSARTVQAFPSILFGDAWSGSLEDLHRLRWLVEYTPENEFEGASWLLSFEGPGITDEWLERIRTLNNVVAVKIRSTGITDKGIAHLRDLKQLRFVDILYNPLSPSCVPYLGQLTLAVRMRLYGTKLDKAAIDELRVSLKHAEIDDRNGGFLGVGCDFQQPCRITKVAPGTAAERGGFQIGDLIVSFNGQPVDSFETLTQLIGQKQPGDEVPVELDRAGERMIVKVTLGECLE